MEQLIGEEIVLRRKAVLPDGHYIWEGEDGSGEFILIDLNEAAVLHAQGIMSDPKDRATWYPPSLDEER